MIKVIVYVDDNDENNSLDELLYVLNNLKANAYIKDYKKLKS